MSLLADKIPAGTYTGRALVDADALDALFRLCEGGLRHPLDLELCEIALTGILLHENVSCLDEFFQCPPMEAAGFLEPLPTVDVGTFSSDDPSIPASVLAELEEAERVRHSYVAASYRFAVDSGDALREHPGVPVAHSFKADGTRLNIPVPAMGDVMMESIRLHLRAFRLISARLGGASLIVSDEGGSEPGTIPRMLQKLDEHFDAYSRLREEASARPSIVVPCLLRAVLTRAPSRYVLPQVIDDIRRSLAKPVTHFFRELFAAQMAQDWETAGQLLLRQEARMSELLATVGADRRRIGLRDLAPELVAAAALTKGLASEPVDLATVIVGVAGWLASRGAKLAAINRPMSPSLADSIFRLQNEDRTLFFPEERLRAILEPEELRAVLPS